MQPSLTVTRESLGGEHILVPLPGSQQSSESDCLSQSGGWPEIDSNCFYVLKLGRGWGLLVVKLILVALQNMYVMIMTPSLLGSQLFVGFILSSIF